MVDQADLDVAETTDDYYRFQVRDPEQFDEVTDGPDWAQETADTVSDGATVRTGSVPDSDALQIASVRVPRKPNLGEAEAKDVATKIVEKVRS